MINDALRSLLGERGGVLRAALGMVVTLLAVNVAWVVFRSNSLEVAISVLQAMLHGTATEAAEGAWLGAGRIMPMGECLWWLAICAAICLLLPNAYQMLGRGPLSKLEQRLSGPRGGLLMGILLALSLLLLSISETRGTSEFLYFNF